MLTIILRIRTIWLNKSTFKYPFVTHHTNHPLKAASFSIENIRKRTFHKQQVPTSLFCSHAHWFHLPPHSCFYIHNIPQQKTSHGYHFNLFAAAIRISFSNLCWQICLRNLSSAFLEYFCGCKKNTPVVELMEKLFFRSLFIHLQLTYAKQLHVF